ncbi:MAG: YdiU family protein [Bergeyella sp.]
MNLSRIKQPYLELFPGDFTGNPIQRQTPKVLFSVAETVKFPDAELLVFNKKLAEETGIGTLESEQDEQFLFGNYIPPHLKTYSTAYAGHQFGSWAGQLGDGRAIFAGEITDDKGRKTEIQWKGAGATPYSRHADGRAVLRSSVREYLMSEAMFHLGIPTTRALSLALTGEKVVRDMMYNGNPKEEKGAVIIRTAESFLRFGHFELLSAQKETDILKKLADFSIREYFPEINPDSESRYKEWFEIICKKTADLMTEWLRVGFVHGVMNTDNMSVLGLTIDYGPFSMLDGYDLNFTPNATDLPGRRYAFGQQPQIAQWNLWQFSNAVFPLINDVDFLENTLGNFSVYFWKKHDEMLCRKFGFGEHREKDDEFFTGWQQMMQDSGMDHTLFFNQLEKWEESSDVRALFQPCFYHNPEEKQWDILETFMQNYKIRLAENTISKEESLQLMQNANPKFILRNYLLYNCIEELNHGKTELLHKLLKALENPYQEIFSEFSQKRPQEFDGTIGCSMLSCSS